MVTEFAPLVCRPFRKVLIANRGEIAVRIIRACRDMGISPVAVYSLADLHSRHVALADSAFCIGEGPSQQSYLCIEKILAVAKDAGVDAIHPGYGFLSESAEFAEAVIRAGLVWIGPPPSAIALLGNKTLAKSHLASAGVPCSPGKNSPLADINECLEVAAAIGYPLIIKAAAGGGGRGMRVVRSDEEVPEAFLACQREALAFFGNRDIFCEKYIEKPRHIEFQILADSHGNVIHLYERDCTIQRRHQKLIEEAPSSFITSEVREAMGDIAVVAARAAGYVGAGTVEFILESPEKFYFMEMNTRIQVEHPITEMITGVDLVVAQLQVAMGEPLAWKQEEISVRGWSFEARINAEDSLHGFLPDPGKVNEIEFPSGPGIRVDSHAYCGYKIPEFYDSMIAKLIVKGRDRNDAIAKMKRALNEFHIVGVKTTLPFHKAVFSSEIFSAGIYDTSFIQENPELCAGESEAIAINERPALNVDEAILYGLRVALKDRVPKKEDLSSLSKKENPINVNDSVWALTARREGNRS